jgi:hypothetical protein
MVGSYTGDSKSTPVKGIEREGKYEHKNYWK